MSAQDDNKESEEHSEEGELATLAKEIFNGIKDQRGYNNSDHIKKFLEELSEEKRAKVVNFRREKVLRVPKDILSSNHLVQDEYEKNNANTTSTSRSRWLKGWTLLHITARYNDLNSVELLIEYGADVTIATEVK